MTSTPRSLRRAALWLSLSLCACSDPPTGSPSDASPDRPTAPTDAGPDASDSGPPPGDASGQDVAPADVTSPDTPAADAPAVDTPGADGSVTDRARLEGLVPEVARALCDALYRCCDAQSRAAFLAPMRANERLASLRDRLPADGSLDRAACPAVLADVYRVMPLGSWVDASLAGRVTFRPSEADACLQTLASATCGEALGAALTDGTCFGFSAPDGGASQRRMFARTAGDGTACVAILDGVGGSFYGTCDPTRTFCCGGAAGRCALVGSGTGVCRPVAAVGAACGLTPELRVCATGSECDSATGRCAALSTTPLAVGAPCAEGFRLLGECRDSYCDLGGTNRCVALGDLGAACSLPYECRSGSCASGRCSASTFCVRPG